MTTDTIERLRYYQHQVLGALDFADEQAYHRDMRRRHNLAHHTWGIVAGLELAAVAKEDEAGAFDVYIMPGMAVDGFGREIIVLAPAKLELAIMTGITTLDPHQVWIAYCEEQTRRPAYGYEPCVTESQFGRLRETYRIVVDPGSYTFDDIQAAGETPEPGALTIPPDLSIPYQEFPADADDPFWLVRLGSVGWNDGKFTAFSNEAREYVGSVAAELLLPQRELRIRDRFLDPLGATVTIEGALSVQRLLTAEQDLHVGGKVGIGTAEPGAKLHVDGGSDAALGGGGYVVIGTSTGLNLALDTNEIMARDNKGISPLYLQNDGGDLYVHNNLTEVGKKFVITKEGKVGIGTVDPSVKLHIVGGSQASLANGSGALVIGSVTDSNLVLDGSQIMARRNGTNNQALSLQTHGGAIWVHGSQEDSKRLVIFPSGAVAIGTSNPDYDAKLDVHGRIMRYGQAFSVVGTANHNELIRPPEPTSTEDWNIFVSPRVVGDEETGSEGDNALLKFECWAEENSVPNGWKMHVRYKYKFWNERSKTGIWSDDESNVSYPMDLPEVNYILIPK